MNNFQIASLNRSDPSKENIIIRCRVRESSFWIFKKRAEVKCALTFLFNQFMPFFKHGSDSLKATIPQCSDRAGKYSARLEWVGKDFENRNGSCRYISRQIVQTFESDKSAERIRICWWCFAQAKGINFQLFLCH